MNHFQRPLSNATRFFLGFSRRGQPSSQQSEGIDRTTIGDLLRKSDLDLTGGIDLDFNAMAQAGRLIEGLIFRRPGTSTGGVVSSVTSAWDDDGNAYGVNQPVFADDFVRRDDGVPPLKSTTRSLQLDIPATQYLADPMDPKTQVVNLPAGIYTLFCRASPHAKPDRRNACTITGLGVVPAVNRRRGTGNTTNVAIASHAGRTVGLSYPFRLAEPSTVTVTPSGSLLWFNLTDTSFATSPILASQARTSRAPNQLYIKNKPLLSVFRPGAAASIFVDLNPRGFSSARYYLLDAQQDGLNRIQIRGDAGAMNALIFSDGVHTHDSTFGHPVPNRPTRVCFSYDQRGSIAVRDMHNPVSSSRDTAIPTVASLHIGGAEALDGSFSGMISRITVYSRRLTREQVTDLTLDRDGLVDDFQRPDGPIDTTPSKQPYLQVQNSTSKHTIHNRQMYTAPSGLANTAAYTGFELGNERLPREMAAQYTLTDATSSACTAGGGSALLSVQSGITAINDIVMRSAHPEFVSNGIHIGIWDDHKYLVPDHNHYYYSDVEVMDGETRYYVAWSIDELTQQVTVIGSDRQYYAMIYSPFIEARGRFVIWESYGGTCNTCVARFSSIWVK